MDAPQRTRSCCRTRPVPDAKPARGAKQVVIPMDRATYDHLWHDPAAVRHCLNEWLRAAPELFPPGMDQGFQLTGRLPVSKKLPGVRLRQLRLADGRVFTLRPSFVLSYLAGTVDEVAYPLLLLSYGVPTWVVTHGFGHNDMFWQRLVERLGRNSLVGTTVRDPQRLPAHLAADEHHAAWGGAKGYVALTAGGGCVLGLALTAAADDTHLTAAYGTFRDEAHALDPTYAPQTVNTDGWKATQQAWQALFPLVVLLRCFLHGWLNIRRRGKLSAPFAALAGKVWEAYHAPSRRSFGQRMRRLWEWAQEQVKTTGVLEQVQKLCGRAREYGEAYRNPGGHRTSNMLDRPMRAMNRYFDDGQHLHGSKEACQRHCRAWALLHNFRPWGPEAGRQNGGWHSPAERLNQHRYQDDWLQNLLVSASRGGYRR